MKNIKIISLLIAVAAFAVAAATIPIGSYVRAFLEWVETLGVWGPVLLGAAYIPATVLFIPGSVLTLGAGALFGVVVGTAAVSLGSVAGSTAAFLVGRFFAREWVASKVQSNPRFNAIDDAVNRNGFKIVMLTRLSPVFPYNLLGYMYGITKVRLIDYVLASWVGMFPGTVMYVYLGSAVGLATSSDRDRTPGEYALFGVGLVATIVVTVLITKIARKALQETTPKEVTDGSGIDHPAGR